MTTSPLRERLSGLAGEWGSGSVPPDADRLWRAGRARRVRGRFTVGGVVVLVLLLAVSLLGPAGSPVAVPAGGGDEGVAGHPQRIGHRWWVPDLGDRPGAMAGLLQSVDGTNARTTWFAVSADGALRRVPKAMDGADTYPALSDDGRVVGYLAGAAGPYVLHDLVTGQERRFAEVTDGSSTPDSPPRGRWWVQGQTPAWFSPDSRRVAVPVGTADGRAGALVLGLDGSRRFVETPPSRVAGWLDDRTLVGVTGDAPLRVWTRGLDAAQTRPGPVLQPATALAPEELSQWSFRWLAAEGRLVYETTDAQSQPRLGFVDVSTGAVTPGVVANDESLLACGPAEVGGRPALTQLTGAGGSRLTAPRASGPRVVVSVDPALHPRCAVWAQHALDGAPAWSPFGTSEAWPAWWWRECLAGLGLLLAASWWWRRRAHRAAGRY